LRWAPPEVGAVGQKPTPKGRRTRKGRRMENWTTSGGGVTAKVVKGEIKSGKNKTKAERRAQGEL